MHLGSLPGPSAVGPVGATPGPSPFELLYGRKPRGCLKKTGRKVQAHLRNKFNKLWTKATHSGEVVIGECPPDPGTGTQQRGEAQTIAVLLPFSSSKLLAKWQRAMVGDVDLNLLKASREAKTTSAASLVKGKDKLGPGMPCFTIPTSLHREDYLTQPRGRMLLRCNSVLQMCSPAWLYHSHRAQFSVT